MRKRGTGRREGWKYALIVGFDLLCGHQGEGSVLKLLNFDQKIDKP